MADTTARTLRLLSLLQRRRYWSGPELAGRLGISDRTLRRDVERLRQLGYTVHSERGIEGGYRLGTADGPALLLLDDDEATALAVALNAAATGPGELAEAALGALTNVLPTLGPAQRRRAETVSAATSFGSVGPAGTPDLAVLDTVASACRDEVRLSFDYRAADGNATSRYVEPLRLVALGGRWYLVAWDGDRDDWRTFRVDRMRSPVPARNRFTPRAAPATDLSEYVRRSLRGQALRYRVVVDLAAPADRVREAYGVWATVERRSAQRCRLTMDTDSFSWPTHVLAELGVPFTVVSPPELVEHLRGVAERLAESTRPR